MGEIYAASLKLSNNKSPDNNGLQVEHIKYATKHVHQDIANLLNEVADTGTYPQELEHGLIIPIQKPGNNTCQSACRPGHSTETALLKVVNDLFLSLNKGNISVLALLDFSSAFDTIDHPILVHRLHTDIGFTDTVLQ